MAPRTPRLTRAEAVLLVALAGWGLFPVVLLLLQAGRTHTQFTGANGLIGADGVLGADQLQYLAWVRDAAAHGLSSDLFTLGPSGHVYLEPIFTIAGGLYRLGVPLVLAYVLFTPIAIVALGAGGLAWARRTFPDQPGARAAVIALSLFLATPVAAFFSWTQLAGGSFRFSLFLLGNELGASEKVWGYVPSAIGLALVPVALLAIERAVRSERSAGSARAIAAATGAALFSSWLHPWQGVTLVLIVAGLTVIRRPRDRWTIAALALPALGAALPLIYYHVLSHEDPAWELASQYEVIKRLPALALLAGLGPLALIAAPGVRRPRGDLIEQALLLWIAASLVNYFVDDSFAPHALQGLSLPFAVLAVRSFQRLALSPAVGIVAIALVTLPGMAFDARKFVRTADSPLVQYYLPASDRAALRWVADHAPPGGVLAPTPFAAVVPSQTGRAVWVGDGYWSRSYPQRARRVDRLFAGRDRPAATAVAFVRATGARILISDCGHRRNLSRALEPVLESTHRFGCARVYVIDR